MFSTSTLKKHLPLRSKFAVLCIVFLLLANLLQGCGIAPTKTEEPRQARESTELAGTKPSGIHTVAIVPSEKQPMADIEGMLGKEAGAAIGVATGAAVGFGIYMVISASCLFTAGGCVALAPLLAGGALAGGVIGATAEAPADAQRDQATSAATVLDIQTSLALIVRNAADRENHYRFIDAAPKERTDPEYASLASRGINTVIEVGLSTIQMDKAEYLRMRGQARILTLPGAKVKDTQDFEFVFLESHSAADWVANKGKAIGDALAKSLPPMGYRIAEELFVIHPAATYVRPQPIVNAEVQPVLTWKPDQSRSRNEHLPNMTGFSFELAVAAGKADDVCLDWLARDHGIVGQIIDPPCLLATPERLIYRRKGLKEAAHQLDISLAPCTSYAWSVRAESRIGGQIRHSEWAPWASLTTRCDLLKRDQP